MRGAAALALGALLLVAPLRGWSVPADPGGEPPDPTYHEAIDVSLVTMVVRVVDTWGNPILDLRPEDFRVRLGRVEAPVLAVDWVTAGEPLADDAGAESEAATAVAPDARAASSTAATRDQLAMETAEGGGESAPRPPPAAGDGRLVVIFVQADLLPSRISGQMRLRPYTRELLATLAPSDRVAVVSFDSHLKLWQDFSRDAVATHAAIDEAMLFSSERPVRVAEPPSLAAHFDLARARAAPSPERALELVARALEPLPGEKVLLYLGFGFGRFSADGVRMRPAYRPAVNALRAARAAVFALDVTSADGHSLSAGLENVAEATGGEYFSTFRLPGLATRAVARTLAGYYLLTLDPGAFGGGEGRIAIQLRGRQGTVLARPLSLR